MSESLLQPAEEAATTQITLFPDGRVHVHGTTRQILELLEALHPRDEWFAQLVQRAQENDHGK